MIPRLLTLAGGFALGQIAMMSQKDPSFKADLSKAQGLDKVSVLRSHLTTTNKTRVDKAKDLMQSTPAHVKTFVDEHETIKNALHSIENNITGVSGKSLTELESDAQAMYTYIQEKTSDTWHDIDSRYDITTRFHALLADVQRIKEKKAEPVAKTKTVTKKTV